MKKINLVLGGGGPSGFAHVGVLRFLVEHEYEITSITGTSVGALIGSLYAYFLRTMYAGVPVQNAQRLAVRSLERVAQAENFGRFEDSPSLGNRLKNRLLVLYWGREAQNWLMEMLLSLATGKGLQFRELGYEFQVLTVNAETGELLQMSPASDPDVDFPQSIRASISIPIIFQGALLERNGGLIRCWDGGLAGNCRADLAEQINPQIDTVASTLTYGGSPSPIGSSNFDWRGVIDEVLHVSNILQMHAEKAQFKNCANRVHVVHTQTDDVSLLSFNLPLNKRLELFERGWVTASQVLLGRRSNYLGASPARKEEELLSACVSGTDDERYSAEDEFKCRGLRNVAFYQIRKYLVDNNVTFSEPQLKATVLAFCDGIWKNSTSLVAYRPDDMRGTIRLLAHMWIAQRIRKHGRPIP